MSLSFLESFFRRRYVIVRDSDELATDTEKETLALIGQLVWEDSALEKQIGSLRDDATPRAKDFGRIGRALVFSTERAFSGDRLDPQSAGEPAMCPRSTWITSPRSSAPPDETRNGAALETILRAIRGAAHGNNFRDLP